MPKKPSDKSSLGQVTLKAPPGGWSPNIQRHEKSRGLNSVTSAMHVTDD